MDIDKLFIGLNRAADKLNEVSNSVSEKLSAIEARLNSLGMGLEVWIELRDVKGWYMGYAKVNKTWGIYVSDGPYYETGNAKPFKSASRDVRISMLSCYDELLDALLSKASQTIDRIDSAGIC